MDINLKKSVIHLCLPKMGVLESHQSRQYHLHLEYPQRVLFLFCPPLPRP